jgi:predicted SprT family Zn-dependent metalloprotease
MRDNELLDKRRDCFKNDSDPTALLVLSVDRNRRSSRASSKVSEALMKIAKVEYKCECGAEIIVGQEDLRKINEDKHVVIRCVWCGRTAENKKEIVDVLYKWSEG